MTHLPSDTAKTLGSLPRIGGIKGLSSGRVIKDPTQAIGCTLLSDNSSDVEARLAEIGVVAPKLHRPNHLHTIFQKFASEMPGLDEFYRKLVHIPAVGGSTTNHDI